MAHIIFCVSGFSGVGKDEFCKRLVDKHQAIQTGLADPAKRHMADVYGFSKDQLFGPSQMRNAGDPRYPKNITVELGARPATNEEIQKRFSLLYTEDELKEKDFFEEEKGWWCFEGKEPPFYLPNIDHQIFFFKEDDQRFFVSPRETLQLYCALMNEFDQNTWVRHGVKIHRILASSTRYSYSRMFGLEINYEEDEVEHTRKNFITCFSDFRHKHEVEYVRKLSKEIGDFKPIVVRVKRPGLEKPPFDHKSETEQLKIHDNEFDYVVHNDSDIESLYRCVDKIVEGEVR